MQRVRKVHLVAFAILFALKAQAQILTIPVPFIDQPLVPTSLSPGGGAFTLVVNGA